MDSIEKFSREIYHQGNQNCILMIHGLGSGPQELAQLAKYANEEGFSVLVPCIKGYCFGEELENWNNWLDQILGHYKNATESYKTVSLVGLSMGATLAMAAAENVQPLANVFLASALGYDGWSMPWYAFLLPYASLIPFSNLYKYKEKEPFGVKNLQMRNIVRRTLETNKVSEIGGSQITLDQIREGYLLIKEVKENLEKIISPSLIIHAVDDESVHIRNALNAFDRISTHEKQFIYLGDSYHVITVDNEKDYVYYETLRFIKNKVNGFLGKEEFETQKVISHELRRYLSR